MTTSTTIKPTLITTTFSIPLRNTNFAYHAHAPTSDRPVDTTLFVILKMVGNPKHDSEGDLFPRGRAPDAAPRVQKRNGKTLFAPHPKRPRTSRSSHTLSQSSVLQHGASLSMSRLSIGMTLLALVTRADRSGIELVIPGGLRATVANHEFLLHQSPADHNISNTDDESSTDLSDDDTESIRPAWEVVTVGTITPAAVVDLQCNDHGKKLLKLSLKPHLINVGLNPSCLLIKDFTAYGAIKSIEDYGYVVSFGANIPHTAFLPFEKTPINAESRLHPGTPVTIVTTENVNLPKRQRKQISSSLRVSALRRDVLTAVVNAPGMTYQDLQAGMLLRSRIVREGPGGVSLSAFGIFDIDVDSSHVPRKADGSSDLSPGEHVLARLLYVDPAQKRIGATLLYNFVTELSPRAVPPHWRTGTTLKPLQVERVEPEFGLLMRLVTDTSGSVVNKSKVSTIKDGEESSCHHDLEVNIPVFAHISRISDSRGAKIESLYHSKSIIKDGARVVSISRFDGVVNVDLRQSVLSRKALSLDEIEVGEVYSCKILRYTTMSSLLVAIDGDPYLPGVVLPTHISDVPIPSKRLTNHPTFRIGASIKCRALSVKSGGGNVFLTARKSLVSPRYPMLTSYDQAWEALKERKTSTQTISNDAEFPRFTGTTKGVTQRAGLLISFCNNVVGLVPTTELCLDSARQSSQSEVENLYPIGETVHVRLLKVDPKNRRMLLSMNLEAQTKKMVKKKAFEVGQLVKARICAIDTDARHFIVDASAVPAQDSEEGTPRAAGQGRWECYLPFGHLSDNIGVCERLAGELQLRVRGLGDKETSSLEIPQAMVICYRDDVAVLTVKTSLIAAKDVGRLPKSFDEVQLLNAAKGETNAGPSFLRGYIKALLPSGAIIGFLGDCVGFLRNSRVADYFVSNPARSLKMHQSISTIVESVDKSSRRFSLSMRPSDVGREGSIADTLSLFRSLEGWKHVLGLSCVENGFQIGRIVNASVSSISTYGVQYELKAGKRIEVGVAYGVTGALADVVVNNANVDTCEPTSQTRASDAIPKHNPTRSTVERVRILDVDPVTGVIDLSRDECVIAQGEKKSVLSPGASFVAEVLLVKSAYVILAVKRSKSRTAIAYALGPVSQENLLIRPGAEVNCLVLDKARAKTSRNLVLVDWESFRRAEKHAQMKPTTISSECTRTISALKNSTNVDEAGLIGMRIAGKVTRKFRLHAFVGIAPGIVGHLHVTNTSFMTSEELSELSLGVPPLDIASKYLLPELGKNLKVAYFAGIRRAADAEASDRVTVEMALCKERCFTRASSVGEKLIGFVKRPSSRFTQLKGPECNVGTLTQTLVAISPTSLVSCADVDCLFTEDVTIQEGTPVICQVIALAEDGSGRTRGVISANGENRNEGFLGLVQSVHPGRGIRVSVPWLARKEVAKSVTWGFVDICDVANNFDETENLMNELQPGRTVRIYTISSTQEINSDGKDHILLSMRNPHHTSVRDPLITKENVNRIEEGSSVRGFVQGVGKKGCFVSIGRQIVAQVRLCDLADEFVKDPRAEFPSGKLVSGLAYKVKPAKKETRISLVLRRRPRKELRTVSMPSELKEGSKVWGVVQRVTEYGAFIEIAPRCLALLHKSEADQDRFIEDPRKEWMIGQKITAIVIRIADGKIKLGTKRCYFAAIGMDGADIDKLLARNLASRNEISSDKTIDTSDKKELNVSGSSEEHRQEIDLKNSSDIGHDALQESQNSSLVTNRVAAPLLDTRANNQQMDFLDSVTWPHEAPPLDVSGEFDFSEPAQKQDGAASSDEERGDQPTRETANKAVLPELSKKSSRDKRRKKRLREAAERDIRIREEALAQNPDAPETAEDFERLLLGDPNSSVLWIRYMAFCVQLSQIDKARSTAERALEAISLHSEEERVNVWCAYVNLEAQFGSLNAAELQTEGLETNRNAAVFRVFERACERITDVKDFHLQVSSALRRNFPDLADEVLRRGVRRFKSSSELWIAMGKSHFTKGDIQGARKTLERALIATDKREHVYLIHKYAQFEYRYGSAERGRTVFESLIGNLPKRVDLWNIYLDMEVGQYLHAKQEPKNEFVVRTRQLFERFASLDLSSKKMKFAFKKWLRFEKTYGTKENEAEVKSRARTYVERNVTEIRNEKLS